MAVTPRTRFEVFKRDDFTCRYCGRKSPEVVLEADHIVPLCDGGTDDHINLTTSCWECNRGKSGVPLSETMTGEDPHDRAVMLLEQERQLREYNEVLTQERSRREARADILLDYWCSKTGVEEIPRRHFSWLMNELARTPDATIRNAMDVAVARGMVRDWRYLMVVVRNWREDARV